MKKLLVFLVLIGITIFALIRAGIIDDEPQKTMLPIPKFQKGYSFLLYGYDKLNTDEYWFLKRAIAILDRLQDDNVNSVSLVFPITQDGYTGTNVSNTTVLTPGKNILRIFIREAHKRNMVVMLRPILDEGNFGVTNGEWRGNIQPTDRKAWMESYKNVMLDYAQFSESEKVELFDIGTELDSMVGEHELWRDYITNIRSVYSGKLTYSFNWNSQFDESLAKQLDYIGFDAFYPIDQPSEEAWSGTRTAMQEYSDLTGKPILFTELGTRSQRNSYHRPWDWVTSEPADQTAQSQYFQTFCNPGKEMTVGWYIWFVTTDSLDIIPNTDTSYDPTNKTAESDIRECYGEI